MEILAPWGPAIDERPPVPTEAERLKIKSDEKARKVERRKLREEGGAEGEATAEGGKGEVKPVKRKRRTASS